MPNNVDLVVAMAKVVWNKLKGMIDGSERWADTIFADKNSMMFDDTVH